MAQDLYALGEGISTISSVDATLRLRVGQRTLGAYDLVAGGGVVWGVLGGVVEGVWLGVCGWVVWLVFL